MATMMTRVNGRKVSFDTRYHAAGDMATALGMLVDMDSPIFEIFCQVKGGSKTVGFVRDYEAADDYASALGGGHDYCKIA